MPAFEGLDSDFALLDNYTWWFIVTATTVGYGDMAPATVGGRIVAVLVMVFGIGSIAVAVGKVAERVVEFSRRKVRGMTSYKGDGHLVIFGYRKGEAERLVREIRADDVGEHSEIVLCSQVVEENPLPDQVRFVRGQLDSVDVLERASISTASHVIIHGQDDNETLVIALAVRSMNKDAHVVAHVYRHESETHLRRVDPRIECVTPMSVPLLVQAIQDAGATAVIQAMLSNTRDDTLYRIDIPEARPDETFGELTRLFVERAKSRLLAYASNPEDRSTVELNPPDETRIQGGMCLYYLGPRRLDPRELGW